MRNHSSQARIIKSLTRNGGKFEGNYSYIFLSFIGRLRKYKKDIKKAIINESN